MTERLTIHRPTADHGQATHSEVPHNIQTHTKQQQAVYILCEAHLHYQVADNHIQIHNNTSWLTDVMCDHWAWHCTALRLLHLLLKIRCFLFERSFPHFLLFLVSLPLLLLFSYFTLKFLIFIQQVDLYTHSNNHRYNIHTDSCFDSLLSQSISTQRVTHIRSPLSGIPSNGNASLYRAASMQGSLSHEWNIRSSVKYVNCDKTKETYNWQ